MRMSERSGAQVYTSLRSRASSLRGEIFADQKTLANNVSERLVIGTSLTAFVFVIVLATPFILQFAQMT
jgi:hypothetical protein